MNQLQADIETWINDWVSVYNSALEAVPCPFAKQAYVDNKIHIIEITAMESYSPDELVYGALDGVTQNWPDDKEVVIFGCRPNLISAEKLAATVAECNSATLIPRGYIALEDHPDAVEIIAGENMNQGDWALILIQSKDKLDKASDMLAKQGYYRTWSQENLNDVVNWRKKS